MGVVLDLTRALPTAPWWWESATERQSVVTVSLIQALLRPMNRQPLARSDGDATLASALSQWMHSGVGTLSRGVERPPPKVGDPASPARYPSATRVTGPLGATFAGWLSVAPLTVSPSTGLYARTEGGSRGAHGSPGRDTSPPSNVPVP